MTWAYGKWVMNPSGVSMAAKKFRREALLKAEQFRHVQRDFLAVLLEKEEYTLAEAQKIVSDWERSN